MLGILGGSGVYNIEGLENTRWVKAVSPFGKPSDEVLIGELAGQSIAFLPRHGRGHRIPPSEINFRANIDALKRLGVTDIVSVSAVGSLREHLTPGMFVIVSMAHPVCSRLGQHLYAAAQQVGIPAAHGGTYLVMEGPQFSSLAESELYRSWQCDVIGMTNMPEAKLAREAEICYATVAMVTDYDCWHPNHDDVTVDAIVKVLLANADKARALVKTVAPLVHGDAGASECSCRSALQYAIITAPEARDAAMVEKLSAVAGRMLNSK
jgi:5'-methylthioadenosine phosphorylase